MVPVPSTAVLLALSAGATIVYVVPSVRLRWHRRVFRKRVREIQRIEMILADLETKRPRR